MKSGILSLLLCLMAMTSPIAWAHSVTEVSGVVRYSDGTQVEVSKNSRAEVYQFLFDFVSADKDGRCQLLQDGVVDLEIEKRGEHLTVSENGQQGTFTTEELLKILAESESRRQLEESNSP